MNDLAILLELPMVPSEDVDEIKVMEEIAGGKGGEEGEREGELES